MRFKRPMGEQTARLCGTIDGYDHDVLEVHYEVERPDPSVGFDGGIVINSIISATGKDIYGDATEAELDHLACELASYASDEDYGDYLYDLRRDER